MNTRNITLHVNEEKYNLTVDANQTLLQVLRDLGSTGTKYGCGTGECGACTVHVDGKTSILACLTLAALCDGKHITTKFHNGLDQSFTESIHGKLMIISKNSGYPIFTKLFCLFIDILINSI